MVRDLQVADQESQVGYYVGLLTSVFSAAQFMSAIPWGLLSDRFGRKPIVMIGLSSTTISMLLFGLSPSYAFALTVKFVSGLMDGNIGILKSMIQEITINCTQEQRARAFSFLQITFGLGTTVGVFIGGSLYNPVGMFPGLFEHHDLLKQFLMDHPAFLPCLASALISSIGWLLGALFLKETLMVSSSPALDEEQDETTPLLIPTTTQQYQPPPTTSTSYSSLPGQHRSDDSHSQHVSSIAILSKLKKSLTGPVVYICLTYGMVAFQNTFYDTLFVIWSPSDIDQGGIGLEFFQTALILTISGIVTLVTQLIFFHRLVHHFGTLTLYHWTLIISIIVFFVQGFTRLIYYLPIENTEIDRASTGGVIVWIVWSVAMMTTVVKTVCQTILMTSSVMLTNDAAPTFDSLGTINGFSMCVAALTRALGPVVCGLIWSW
ncbi:major facilitator superfamily domain-containing protein [Chlamydoabsidia padenii]|nr:major facilitator superfamily domain-containing protein [Chlamydoabsidia padenii]